MTRVKERVNAYKQYIKWELKFKPKKISIQPRSIEIFYNKSTETNRRARFYTLRRAAETSEYAPFDLPITWWARAGRVPETSS